MLRYMIYQNNNPRLASKGLWYARAVVNQTINLAQLAEHMANHHTPYSSGAILGVLTDMVKCIHELVLEGNAVKIPDLAIFSVGLTCAGAPSADKFSTAYIQSAHLRARSTGKFTRKELSDAARLQEAEVYDPGKGTGSSTGGGSTDEGSDVGGSTGGGSTSGSGSSTGGGSGTGPEEGV